MVRKDLVVHSGELDHLPELVVLVQEVLVPDDLAQEVLAEVQDHHAEE